MTDQEAEQPRPVDTECKVCGAGLHRLRIRGPLPDEVRDTHLGWCPRCGSLNETNREGFTARVSLPETVRDRDGLVRVRNIMREAVKGGNAGLAMIAAVPKSARKEGGETWQAFEVCRRHSLVEPCSRCGRRR